MNAQFVLYVTYSYATLTLVIDKHRQSATVSCALFRTSENEVYVRVSIGNEALHAVQQPTFVFFRVSGFQHNALQVGTGIGFGKVHRHCFSTANAWYILLSLLFITEFIERFNAILQAPNILKACVGR